MKKFITSIIVLISVTVVLSPNAFAHEYVSDTSLSRGAVVHVAPADDPVAGELTNIYLTLAEIDDVSEGYKINASIEGQSGKNIPVYASGQGNTIKLSYTFPEIGSYDLIVYIENSADFASSPITVKKVIDVNRSIYGDLEQNNPSAEIISGLLVLLGLMLAGVMWLNRKAIMRTVLNDKTTR